MKQSEGKAPIRVNRDRLWEHAKALCQEIGPRLSGTPEGARTVEYIAQHFRHCGTQVEVQDYPCPAWKHESTELLLLAAEEPEPLPVFAQTFTEACDIEAALVPVTSEEELEFAPDLEGKVLLLHGKLATSLAGDRNPRLLS
ncbi:MAG: hypothetical protein HOC74_44665, partial [Gemmatimonadetes bacterium]|nr:hypothetical protein [Gemmatimonadota bacterium]